MDFLSASFRIGRWFGIDVRIHILFVLWIGLQLLNSGADWYYEARFLAMLFGIVLVHEFGHCFGARSVGGDAREILLWPLGGLAFAHAPMTPWAQFVTVACGPLVNLVFCIVSGAVLLALGYVYSFSFSPFTGLTLLPTAPEWAFYVLVFFRVNYFLLLFNLLPIYPLDGGQLFQCLLWPFLGLRQALTIACNVGMAGGALLALLGLTRGGPMLVMIGLFGAMTCWQRLQAMKYGMVVDERIARFDAVGRVQNRRPWWKRLFGSGARKPAENPNPGAWQKRQEQIERVDDEVDRILKKVHDHGIQSLSYVERQTLERATRERRAREERELEERLR